MKELDIRVKVITFDADSLALAYVKQTKLRWPLILDPEQRLYDAYGMTRGSWWSMYGLPSIWKYLRLIVQGHMPGKPGKDWRQLGGDVLIDRQGIVRLHYISTSPHDRPTIDSLLAPVIDSKL
jgi:AhpC/TSA antioxidant enzyme